MKIAICSRSVVLVCDGFVLLGEVWEILVVRSETQHRGLPFYVVGDACEETWE